MARLKTVGIALARCKIAQIDEQFDGFIVSCRLFGRDQAMDFQPDLILLLGKIVEVFCASGRLLYFKPLLFGSSPFCGPTFFLLRQFVRRQEQFARQSGDFQILKRVPIALSLPIIPSRLRILNL